MSTSPDVPYTITAVTGGAPRDRLYRAIIAGAIVCPAVVVLSALLRPFEPVLSAVPAFVVMTHGFMLLASACVAYVALGRHCVVGSAASYWVGVGFATYALFTVFYVLVWPGALAGGHSLIAHTPQLASWFFLISQALLAALLIAAATASRGGAAAPVRVRGGLPAAWLAGVVAASLALLGAEQRLPAMVAGDVFTPVAHVGTWAVALLMAVGAALCARAYRRSHDPLLAYVTLMMMLFGTADVMNLIGAQRYSLLWYVSRLGLIGGSLVILFGLLGEYVALYRREQATAMEAQRRAAELDTTIATMPGPVVIVDAAGMVVRQNHAADALFAWTEEEKRLPWVQRVLGRDPRTPSGERLRVGELPSSRAVRGEAVTGVVFCLHCGGDEEIWLLVSSSPLYAADGVLIGAVTSLSDVTALHRMSTELRASHQELTAAHEELQAGSEELVAINEEVQSGAEQLRSLNAELAATNEELARAETEREQLLAEAARLAAQREATLLSLREGIAVMDTEGRIITMNQACATMHGFANPEEFHRHITEYEPSFVLEYPEGGVIPPSEWPIARALRGETMADCEVWISRLDQGWRRLWSYSFAPVRDADGRIVLAVNTMRDTTDARQAEEELRRHRDELETLVDERTATIRQLAAELALAEQKERQRIATRLHDDVSQTLAFAKLKLGEIRFVTASDEVRGAATQLGSLIDETIAHTRGLTYDLSTPILYEKGLAEAVIWTASIIHERRGLPVDVSIVGDRVRLAQDVEITVYQAVKELLNNAVKHAGAAAVRIELGYGVDQLQVLVADEGPGFDPNAIRTGAESGFGLLNVRERLAHIGASLAIDSAAGRGTRCTIAVPIGQGSSTG